MNPPWLHARPDGVQIELRIQPRASRTEVVGLMDTALKVRVAAPPVDDAANAALLRFLADRLHCPRGAVQLIRGRSARRKVVAILGLDAATVVRRLAPGSD